MKTKWILILSLANCMPRNSISLTWQVFGCISLGEGIWQQLLFFQRLESLRLKFFLFCLGFFFLFSIDIVYSHPLWTLSSCFRDDVLRRDRTHLSGEINTTHVFFSSSIALCSSSNVSDDWISPVFSWWSHISKRWIPRALSSLHEAKQWGFIETLFGLFLLCKQCEISPVFFCCNIDFSTGFVCIYVYIYPTMQLFNISHCYIAFKHSHAQFIKALKSSNVCYSLDHCFPITPQA